MLTQEALKKLCGPHEGSNIYFRPLVVKGDISKIGIFVVGINPATTIENNVEIEKYLGMLTDYEDFKHNYEFIRNESGKRGKCSRTRLGIDSLVNMLMKNSVVIENHIAIAETNVIQFPTKNYKELKTLKEQNIRLIDEAKNNFLELLDLVRPKLIIVHSERAFCEFVNLVDKQYKINIDKELTKKRIGVLETMNELFTIPYSAEENGIVVACRHLMLFGNEGHSFAPFLIRVNELIKSLYEE